MPLETDIDEESDRICKNVKILDQNSNETVVFHMKKPVEPFIGRNLELNQLKTAITNQKPIVITGSYGIGKSELARKFSYDYSEEERGSIMWINAELYTTLVSSFEDLASLLKIKTEDKLPSQIIEDTFKYFFNHRALFVFDNASSDNYVLNNLLEKFVIGRPIAMNFIITSRDENWNRNKFNIITLTGFTEEESVEYIKKNIEITNESEKDIKELSLNLKRIPLALSKAAKYIKDQKQIKEYTIKDFVDEFMKFSPVIKTPEKEIDGENEGFEELYPVEEISPVGKALENKIVPENRGFEELYPDKTKSGDSDILKELQRTTVIYITSVRPPTGDETRGYILKKVEKEAGRVVTQVQKEAHRAGHRINQGAKKVGHFFRKLGRDISG